MWLSHCKMTRQTACLCCLHKSKMITAESFFMWPPHMQDQHRQTAFFVWPLLKQGQHGQTACLCSFHITSWPDRQPAYVASTLQVGHRQTACLCCFHTITMTTDRESFCVACTWARSLRIDRQPALWLPHYKLVTDRQSAYVAPTKARWPQTYSFLFCLASTWARSTRTDRQPAYVASTLQVGHKQTACLCCFHKSMMTTDRKFLYVAST